MSTYVVTINENLKKKICVEAETPDKAIEEAESLIYDGKIVLNANDLCNISYNVFNMETPALVVTEENKNDWIKTVLALGMDEDITLYLGRGMFLWIERYQDGKSDSGLDTLRMELNRGRYEINGTECYSVFDEVVDTYEIDFNSMKTVIDILSDIFNNYVKPRVSGKEVVRSALGVAASCGLLEAMAFVCAICN